LAGKRIKIVLRGQERARIGDRGEILGRSIVDPLTKDGGTRVGTLGLFAAAREDKRGAGEDEAKFLRDKFHEKEERVDEIKKPLGKRVCCRKVFRRSFSAR
jgi:hypothetical protein